ncbi:resistance to inhibitors of cholinesterase protein 3-like [Argiope bruennichi]|uniref:resistance to inhibitors of cholinesterase protein 3-like n=1 Tax=Argiope bruennichi TaxID=94029 RepID=UPI00249419BC|nr:resistance to inhibitors of cholinesterase protein 3-like [Argiope bruennichi]XP_055929729.1 resistance to inhibitors of cholinesterase protein 3-like [Argiope bruennichi]
MAATMEPSSRRSLTVLAVVVACFAILWPKIFYPMISSIILPSASEEESIDEIRKLDFYDMIHPQMKEAMGEARPLDKPATKDAHKVLFHPSIKYAAKPQSKGTSAVNLVIPVYTLVVILFFIYSVCKMFLKKKQDSRHLHSTKQQKTACPHKCTELDDMNKRMDNSLERTAQRALEQYGKDKVLTALKAIILEMEDIQGSEKVDEKENKQDSADATVKCENENSG